MRTLELVLLMSLFSVNVPAAELAGGEDARVTRESRFSILPVNTCRTSKYGPRSLDGLEDFHSGTDFRAAVGTPVRIGGMDVAAMAGETVEPRSKAARVLRTKSPPLIGSADTNCSSRNRNRSSELATGRAKRVAGGKSSCVCSLPVPALP